MPTPLSPEAQSWVLIDPIKTATQKADYDISLSRAEEQLLLRALIAEINRRPDPDTVAAELRAELRSEKPRRSQLSSHLIGPTEQDLAHNRAIHALAARLGLSL